MMMTKLIMMTTSDYDNKEEEEGIALGLLAILLFGSLNCNITVHPTLLEVLPTRIRGSYLHHQSHPTLVHFAHPHIPKSAS